MTDTKMEKPVSKSTIDPQMIKQKHPAEILTTVEFLYFFLQIIEYNEGGYLKT